MEKLIFCIFVALFFKSQAIVNYAPAVPGCSGALHPMPNFDIQSFIGVWYEIQRYDNQFENGKCITVNIASLKRPNNTLVTITLTQNIGTKVSTFDQNATMRPLRSGWNFRYNRSLTVEANGSIFVLDTNYLNYAVVYGCGILNKVQKVNTVWILSRSRTLLPAFQQLVLNSMNLNNLTTSKLVQSDQSNCSSGISGL